jgi:hypothetical protein
MITRTKTRIQKTVALLACFGSLMSLTGCFGAKSCIVSNYFGGTGPAGNKDIEETWNKFKKVSNLTEAKDLCWHTVDLKVWDSEFNHSQPIPIEMGFEMLANEGVKASATFSEMLDYARGTVDHASSESLTDEDLIHPYGPTPESVLKKQATFRMPIYKLYPQVKATAMAVKAFCEQTARLRDGKEEGIAAVQKLLMLRDIAAKKHDELSMLMSSPALTQAAKNSCHGLGVGETAMADEAPIGRPANSRPGEALGAALSPAPRAAAGGAREEYPACATHPGVSPCSF